MRMRAAVLERFGEPLEVGEVDLDDPGRGEALVRLVACGARVAAVDALATLRRGGPVREVAAVLLLTDLRRDGEEIRHFMGTSTRSVIEFG
jgi:Zn-dependent alcohol dehydrogenase